MTKYYYMELYQINLLYREYINTLKILGECGYRIVSVERDNNPMSRNRNHYTFILESTQPIDEDVVITMADGQRENDY